MQEHKHMRARANTLHL